jgi:hypothetical protein
MVFDDILAEVGHLHSVCGRLERYAESHPRLAKGLLGIALSVRNSATLLGVLLATKPDSDKPSNIQ